MCFHSILHVPHEIFCDAFLVSALELQVHIYFLVSCLFRDQLVFVFSIVTFYIFRVCNGRKKHLQLSYAHHIIAHTHFIFC